MAGRRVIVLATLFLGLSLAPTATAQNDVDVFNWGVPYFVGTGQQGSAHFSLGPNYNATKTSLLPFDGCAGILARPAKGLGAVDMVGLLDDTNLLEVTFDEFRAPNENMQVLAPQGIGANITLDGSEDHAGKPTHPKVFARVVAWGQAFLTIDGANFTEDGKTPKPFWGSFYITPNGFRNDTTAKVQTRSGATYVPGKTADAITGTQDWELHLRLEATSQQRGYVQTYRPAGDSPDGSVVYEEEHQATFRFLNQAPGGLSNLTISAQSRSPAPGTSLRFVVISPKGEEVANHSVAPTLLTGSQPKVIPLVLNNFGIYTIKVSGKIVMGSYTITNRMTPPSHYDFNMWWDRVAFEQAGIKESSGCKDRLLNNLLPAHKEGVGRNAPPTFNLELVIVTIGITLFATLFAIKLVSDAVIIGQFKSTFKGRK